MQKSVTDVLEWVGPRALWSSDKSRCILAARDAVSAGLYIWTVRVDAEYWINYIGISNVSIVQRQKDHIEKFLSGQYWIYDPNSLCQGRKQAIHDPNKGIEAFLANYSELAQKVGQVLQLFQIFYLPLKRDERELQRIESTLIEVLKNSEGDEADFLDNDKVSIVISELERRTIALKFPRPVAGVPSTITI